MKKTFIASIFVLLLLPALSFSQTAASRESLRGLNGVFINILPIAKDAQSDGLSTSQIQKIIETELRKAGITIQSAPLPSNENANLSIVIDTIKHPQGVYVFTVSVSVVQEAQITHGQKQGRFPVETYGTIALGLTTPNRMDIIYEPLKEKLGEFIKSAQKTPSACGGDE